MVAGLLRDDAALAAGAVAVTALAWHFRGALRVTAVAKASFAFAPDAEMTRTAPDPIVRSEVNYGNNPARSVRLTSDLVPYLNRVDVLLTGHAWPPPRVLVETMPARLGIFDGARALLDKTVMVRQAGGITRVPLVYEGAYGGIGWQENPFGVGVSGTGEPSLVDPADDKRRAGFGPIGRGWPERKRLVGAELRKLLDGDGLMPLPDTFDWDYFQSAPPDQRLAALRGDEWIVMDGMNPKIPRLRVRLPGVRGLGRVYGLGPWGMADGQPLALKADTLRIDCDEERCTLTFRTTFPIADEAALEAIRIALAVELPGQPITWPDPTLFAASAELDAPSSDSIDISIEDFESDTLDTMAFAPEDPRAALPFSGTAVAPSMLSQASPPRPQQRRDHPLDGTIALGPEDDARLVQLRALPFGEPSPPVPIRAPNPGLLQSPPVTSSPAVDPPAVEPAAVEPPSPPVTIAEPAVPPVASIPISLAPAPPPPERERPSPFRAPDVVPEPPAPAPAAPTAIARPTVSPEMKKGLYSRFSKS